MYLKDKVPEMNDDVKSLVSPDMAGTVIAKYVLDAPLRTYLDVRMFDGTICYKTPMSNWEVIRLNDE